MKMFNPFSKKTSTANQAFLANQYAQQKMHKIEALALPPAIIKQLLQAKVFDFWFENKRLQVLSKLLDIDNGEKIIYAARAINEHSEDVLLICTNRRLIILDKKAFTPDKVRQFTLAQIKNVQLNSQIFYSEISLVVGDDTLDFNSVNKAAAPVLVQAIKEQMQKSEHNKEDIEQEVADLKKLKKLVDQGILTQAEFEAKKKQILGI